MPAALPDPARAAAALPRGSAIILRDYDHPDRADLARLWQALARQHGHLFLVGNDSRLAHRIHADGVHWPEYRLTRPSLVRPHPGWLVTAAAHSRTALRRAQALGVDAVLVSPVFATRSHPGTRTLGPLGLGRMIRAARLPVIALGGMSMPRLRRLSPLAIHGFAAIDAFADDRETAASLSQSACFSSHRLVSCAPGSRGRRSATED